MEVPGKQDGDQESTLVCLQCDRDGIMEPACGFCKSCQEHLCETCYNNHRRPKPLRNHILLDKDVMPKTQKTVPKVPTDTIDLCENHRDKPLEFYCNKHNYVVCYVCVTLEHKHCNVDYIPDVSGNVSDKMNSMFVLIKSLIKKCESNIEAADRVTQNIDKSYDEVVRDVKLFRKEVNENLDQMEASILSEADAMRQNAQRKQKTIKATCEEIAEKLTCLNLLFIKLNEENKQTKLFIEMKNAEKRLFVLTDDEKNPFKVNRIYDGFRYVRNTSFLHKLKSENNYGQLSAYLLPSPDRTIDLQYTATINVKSPGDKQKCDIPGIVMIAPSKMIVADRYNQSIKMIDVEKGSVESEIRMSSSPVDAVTIPENKIAVTLHDENCIQIVSYTKARFSLFHRIAVGETCNGLAYCDDKFVVCCQESKKIVIVNFAGDILNVFGSSGLFDGPLRIVISNDEKFLYISDTDWSRKNKVVKIDWEGNVWNVFETPSFTVPYGIQQVEDETLLVCYRDNNTLGRLSGNLDKCEITGIKRTDINNPKALTFMYSDKAHKLYVVCSSKGWLSNEVCRQSFQH